MKETDPAWRLVVTFCGTMAGAITLFSSSNSDGLTASPSHRGDLGLDLATLWGQQVKVVVPVAVVHFPAQICGLINIHGLLLFTPQQLVLIEKFTSYSFSLWTSFHGNEAVSTGEECTFLPPPSEGFVLKIKIQTGQGYCLDCTNVLYKNQPLKQKVWF